MESMGRPATHRQLEYIQQLQKEAGGQGPLPGLHDGLSSFEASKLIADLISQKSPGGWPGEWGAEHFQQPGTARINQARLGLAMKECFRLWTGQGRDIWAEKRQPFIEATIKTYGLFSEIANRLQDGRPSDRSEGCR